MIDLDKLDPVFEEKANELIHACGNAGYRFKPTSAWRDPKEQGKLWRRSRTTITIKAELIKLRLMKCDFLADCIENAGPQDGLWATNAIPGNSWHQWGEALDCLAIDHNTGQIISDGQHPAYKCYYDEAVKLGMTTGYHWGDAGHVQLRVESAPDKLYSLKQINDEMQKRYG